MEATTKTPILIPRFNRLYDSLRSEDGWRHLSDNYATGNISTTVNATATGTVKLANSPHFRLNQWPGAVQVYLMIRFFSIGPTAVPSANGGIECLFYDNSGNVTPLGEYLAQSGGTSNLHTILPIPITDTENTSVGTLSVALANVSSSNGTYNFSFGFSYVYVLPAGEGYSVQYREGSIKYHDETPVHNC